MEMFVAFIGTIRARESIVCFGRVIPRKTSLLWLGRKMSSGGQGVRDVTRRAARIRVPHIL